jgi:hypothetical protein
MWEHVVAVNRERWYRHVVIRKKSKPRERGFFDDYPHFYQTSDTGAKPDRLNQRHRALIASNQEVLRGKSVLDIASHDGRWSLAAGKAGAGHVLGIEAREHLVQHARANMMEYGVGGAEFRQGDVMIELDRLEPGRFDTVLCFGFFYHTCDHMVLLRKIARLEPATLIVDTEVCPRGGTLIELREEATATEGSAAVPETNGSSALIGIPTRAALELMLRAIGFRPQRYYDWRNAGIERWDDLEDYYLGRRISLTATATGQR